MALYSKKQQMRRSRKMQFYWEWARRKWENAFTDDWHHEYLLIHFKAKLETMERYNMHLSYAMNGPYYGHQIKRAIEMIDIILDEGGKGDYAKHRSYMPVAKSFTHYVNMRNRKRIPRPDDEGIYFWSEAQKLRFDKAWMLLWKILSERMMTWGGLNNNDCQ